MNNSISKIFLLPLLKCILMLLLLMSFSRSILAQKQSKKQTVGKVLYGQASFYANKFHGRKTASGEIFNQTKFTCACNALPLGTWVRVTNLKNNKSVIVKVNDRIHPKVRRVVDLTIAAAQKLGFVKSGLTRVKVEVLPKGKY
ncbi:septal ring lytic transglycosylase RlpA family protein [Ferruginibacter sp. SUN002]|uniref:septal ring lytic transglycosylase RlpA family protein n=1 Tax=Ferruginibacter sp. SUN002 TaxID=2937789 RepID=UPI003D35FED0